MKNLQFFILMILFQRMALAQCPSGQKVSKILAGKCISNSACDGYTFKSNPAQCLQQDPSVKPQYNIQSVKCELAKGNDEKTAVYICNQCSILTPFGIDCTGCQNDEYLVYLQTIYCIKKKDFGLPPNTNGFLSSDKKYIVPECQVNEVISEDAFLTEQNKFVRFPFCLICTFDKPYASYDKSLCDTKCFNDEVLDYRTEKKKCIKKQSCDKFISEDVNQGYTCKNECDTFKENYYVLNNLNICKNCPQNYPFITNQGKSCTSDCGYGNIYGEKQRMCIPLTECDGYVIESDQKVCYKDSCPIGKDGKSDTFLINQSSLPGMKYKICRECPENTPFFNNNQCQGCSQNQIIDTTTRTCLNQFPYFINQYNVRQDTIKAVYPLSYCPNGFKMSNQQCIKCPLETPITSPQRNICCKKGQFFQNNQCVDQCSDGVVSNDFSQCISKCPSHQIKTQTLFTYKDQSNKDVIKNITQCNYCKDPKFKIASPDGMSCLSECPSGYYFSDDKNECTIDCQNSLSCFQSKRLCPTFIAYKGEPAIYSSNQISNSSSCIQCPPDKPFMEQTQKGIECTRCLNKIRNYQTGMCVTLMEQIFNPTSGIFRANRQQYWPRSQIENIGCSQSFSTFKYHSFYLKECTQNNIQTCSSPLIYDEWLQVCIQPEKCSTILSRDGKICSKDSCNIDEIQTYPPIDQNDPNYLTKTNNGYLIQCQLCPKNKPLLDKNNINQCSDQCSRYQVQNLQKTMCIEKSNCEYYISSDEKYCVEKCDIREKIVTCFRSKCCTKCPSDLPFVLTLPEISDCYKKCPQNFYNSKSEFQCIPSENCKGFVQIETSDCVDQCLQTEFIMEYKMKKECVKDCPFNYYKDFETKTCQPIYQCKKIYFKKEFSCIDNCPAGYGKTFNSFTMNDLKNDTTVSVEIYGCDVCGKISMVLQNGECKYDCTGNQIANLKTNICIDIEKCEGVVSENNLQCLERCLSNQARVYSYSHPSIPSCISCIKQIPFVDFQGNFEFCTNKCRIFDVQTQLCLKELSNCKYYVKQSSDGTYLCDRMCPQFSFISEKICNDQGNQCYNLCKPCPNDSPLVYKNQCLSECLSSTFIVPDLKICIDQKCEGPQVYDLDQNKCIDIERCDKIVDTDNLTCNRECPFSYKIFSKIPKQCLFAKQPCYGFNEKNFNICSKMERTCLPPMIQIQTKGFTQCVNDFIEVNQILKKQNNDNETTYTVIESKTFKSGIYDQYTSNCNIGEYPRKNEFGQLKCSPCQYYSQFNFRANQIECLQQCKEGYIGDKYKICQPIDSYCSNNKIISSDGKMCTDKCIFPDFNIGGKCVQWKSIDFINLCSIMSQDQILDTTTLPPYRCISRDQCNQVIIGNRCVKECNHSNNTCLYAALNGEKNIKENKQFIIDLIQLEGGITSRETLNLSLMSLDWFANSVVDSLATKKEINPESLYSIQELLETLMNNQFLEPVQEPIIYACKDYQKIGDKLFIPTYNLNKQFNQECLKSNRFFRHNLLNLKNQHFTFGFPDRIKVSYQLIQEGFKARQLIDTNEYTSENNLIQLQEKSEYLNQQDQYIYTQFIKINPYCDEKECYGYPLFYVSLSNGIRQFQIKFSLKPDSPKTICAYYKNQTEVYYKPGCITEDSKFIYCPFQNEINVNQINLVSLYEDEIGQKVKEIQPICSSNNIFTSTQGGANKEEISESKDLNIETNDVSKCKCSDPEQENNDFLNIILISVFSTVLFIGVIQIGIFLIVKNKYQFIHRQQSKMQQPYGMWIKSGKNFQDNEMKPVYPSSTLSMPKVMSNQQWD